MQRRQKLVRWQTNELGRLLDRLRKTDSYGHCSSLHKEEGSPNAIDYDFEIVVGALVSVEPRTGTGINRPGGVARVIGAETGLFDVKYVLGGARECGVARRYLSRYTEESATGGGRRAVRSSQRQRSSPAATDEVVSAAPPTTPVTVAAAAVALAAKHDTMNLDVMRSKIECGAYEGSNGTGVDWSAFLGDVRMTCERVMARSFQSEKIGAPYREARRVLALGEEIVQITLAKVQEELCLIATEEETEWLQNENREPAVQGAWRRTPYETRPFVRLDDYCPAKRVDPEWVRRKLGTSKQGIVTSDEFLPPLPGAPQPPHPDVFSTPPARVGVDIEGSNVWGLDCYTRRTVELALARRGPTLSAEAAAMNPPRLPPSSEFSTQFIERMLLPAINAQSDTDAHDIRNALRTVGQCASADLEAHPAGATAVLDAVSSLQRAVELWGLESFRIFPKGRGMVCCNSSGMPKGTFVSEYFGEVYPAHRWFELQGAIESAQRAHGLQKLPLPSFYNIVLERHRDDSTGYDIVFVDADKFGANASRLSHSCTPNCGARVVAVRGRYTIAVHTLRRIEYGEELTYDYSAVTESEDEFREAICLCGTAQCRGSFLGLASERTLQRVLHSQHTPLDCLALVALEMRWETAERDDLADASEKLERQLQLNGLGPSALQGLPRWLKLFALAALSYAHAEQQLLQPILIQATKDALAAAGQPTDGSACNSRVEAAAASAAADIINSGGSAAAAAAAAATAKKKAAQIELATSAEVEARSVFAGRLQALAVTLDKMRGAYGAPCSGHAADCGGSQQPLAANGAEIEPTLAGVRPPIRRQSMKRE